MSAVVTQVPSTDEAVTVATGTAIAVTNNIATGTIADGEGR